MMLLRQLSFVWKSHFFRHCVAFKEVSRESKKVTKEMTSSCGETILPTILSRYQLCDIYNADEFGLLCKILSSKTLHFKGQCCSEGKHSKKRSLKWLHLPPLVRKHQFLWSVSLLSQDFSSMHEISLVDTKHQKKHGWMKRFVKNGYVNVIASSKDKDEILAWQSITVLHPLKLKDWNLLFLIPNTASCTQAMDQGLIQHVAFCV